MQTLFVITGLTNSQTYFASVSYWAVKSVSGVIHQTSQNIVYGELGWQMMIVGCEYSTRQ